jgi:hypothetical protein
VLDVRLADREAGARAEIFTGIGGMPSQNTSPAPSACL